MEFLLGALIVLNNCIKLADTFSPLELFSAVVLFMYVVRRSKALKGVFLLSLIAVIYTSVVQFITGLPINRECGLFILKFILNATLAVYVADNYRKLKPLRLAFGVALCQAVGTVFAVALPSSLLWEHRKYATGVVVSRLKLLYSEPAYLSFISGILIVIFVYYLVSGKFSWKTLAGAAICLADMLLSNGIGGIITMIIAVVIMLMIYVSVNRETILYDSRGKLVWFFIAIISIASVVLIIMLSMSFGFRGMSILRGTDMGMSLTIQKPLTGFLEIMDSTRGRGIGIGQVSEDKFGHPLGVKGGIINAYFHIMIEGGIPGIILVSCIVFYLFSQCLLYGEALSFGFLIYIIISQFTRGRFDDPVSWIVYGLIVAECLRSKSGRREKAAGEAAFKSDETVVGIIGAKGFQNYGGFETFVDKLTEYHAANKNIRYLVACKANGQGAMDESQLKGTVSISDSEFKYHNALCFKIRVPQIGAGQAILYDLLAAVYCIRYFKKHRTERPVLYVLTCRIGPFIRIIADMIHGMGGEYYVNPDGHEWRRSVWSPFVRKYWKFSERLMVRHADMVVCDSKNIETYINATYCDYDPKTTYIAYGAEFGESPASAEEKYKEWCREHGISGSYWLIVGRFVSDNSFETMIGEYMKCGSERDIVIITNINKKYLDELEETLHFSRDRRINFVGTVYDQVLLKKIREEAFGYLHGHSVGGTNPSLLEALGSTRLNLLLDVGFNHECGEDGALYWTKESGSLSGLIDMAEKLPEEKIRRYSERAKERIREAYSWQYIAARYEELFSRQKNDII